MKKGKGNNRFLGSILVAVSILTATKANAAPALQEEVKFQQPNGIEVKATQYGDEFFHYTVGEDSSLYAKKADGYWYYETKGANTRQKEAKVGIDPKPQNVKMQSDVKDDITIEKKRANFNQRILTKQNKKLSKDQNLLVVLIEFNDVKLTTSLEEWQKKVFSTEGKTVKSFFSEQTNKRIELQPAKETADIKDGVMKIHMDQEHPDKGSGFNIFELATDILQKIKHQIDFSSYDTNKDHAIEPDELHVMFVIAGYEHSAGNIGKGVWGRKGWSSNLTTVDGMKFTDFTMFGEKMKYNDKDISSTIGVICHELGHDLGLPDLYNTEGDGAGLGIMSLMSQGSWGEESGEFGGMTPVGLDAYSKVQLGIPDEEMNPAQKYDKKIHAISEATDPTILKLQSQNQNEYFLLENRQLYGFDKGMRKFNHQLTGGIAVYRVNTDYYKNVGVGKQLVTALEADEGILGYSNYDRNQIFGSNPFYYAGKNLSNGVQPIQINKKTIPSTKLSDGNYLETSLTVMSDSAAEMTVKIGEDGYVPVEKIEIEPKDLTLEFGESIELKATITPENATYKGIEWSEKFFIPSFPKMVDKNGKVTVPKSMFASGILEVTAKSIDGEKSNTIKVKIISKKVTGISLAQENVTLNVDETQKLDYSIQPENAADKRVDWSSSNEEVVTVSKDGVITAKKQGNALVTATTTEGKKTATSKVSVVGRADAEGVFGTVPWSWEKESQTVTFKGGKFFDTDTYNSIYEKIEKLPELEGKKIKKIVFKEPIELSQNSSALFYWLGYLESIEGAHFLDTSKVVDMSLMFMNTLALTSLDIRNWDVSNVKVMNSMFYAAGAIEELDLNTWDVSNVEVMSSMFFNMRKLKKLNINNWDVRNVIEMSDAFNMTLSLPELNLSGWNTNKATGYIQEFTGTNDRLEKFVLGENCQLPIKYYYAGFPMDGGETYTGRWLKVSETGETIKVYETAKDLLDTYDCNGGIFIRERKE